jgi:hypothetical protein
VANGIWDPAFIFGLEVLSGVASRYCRAGLAMLAAGRSPSDPNSDLPELRQFLRESLHDWFFIAEWSCRPLPIDQLDPDIARFCGLRPDGRPID